MEEYEAKPAAPAQQQVAGAATAAESDGSACASAPPAPVVLRSDAIVSLAAKKPRRLTKRGWGPYQSVVKERSADFNLTLDVNNLRQEVQQLTRVRDLQRSKVLIQRHSSEGSLAKMVHECFRVFRHGSPTTASSLETDRRHSTGSSREPPLRTHRSLSSAATTGSSSSNRLRDWRQRQFLHRMMDKRVHFGCDARGPDALADFIQTLSGSLRVLELSLEALEATTADETVIVVTRAKLRFRVVHETIDEQFPHIRAHRYLVSSLVGREVEAWGRVVFFFDEHDKCTQILSDVDVVSAFGAVLIEPHDLAMLLDADFCEALGQEGRSSWRTEYDEPPRHLPSQERGEAWQHSAPHRDATLAYPDQHRSEYQAISHFPRHSNELHESAATHYAPSAVPFPRLARSASSNQIRGVAAGSVEMEVDAIDGYFRCFEDAFALFNPEQRYHRDRIDLVRAFMARSFTPDMRYGHHLAGWSALERRWAALSDSFELRAFRPDGPPHEAVPQQDRSTHRHRVLVVRAVYSLHVTARTLALVFPQLLEPLNGPIQRFLLGQTLSVPSQLTFSLDESLRIARIDEHVEFAATMRSLLRPLEVDSDALLMDALLAESGLEDGDLQGRGHGLLAAGRVRSSSEPTTGSRASQRAAMSFSDLVNG